MKMIYAVIRPEKCQEVKDALRDAGIGGLTLTHVTGHGKHSGIKFTNRIGEFLVDELEKVKIEIVIEDEGQLDDAIRVLAKAAHTGHPGDGRIFVLPVGESYNIRGLGVEAGEAGDR